MKKSKSCALLALAIGIPALLLGLLLQRAPTEVAASNTAAPLSVTLSIVADSTVAIPGGTGNFSSFNPNLFNFPADPMVSDGNAGFWGAGSAQQGIFASLSGTLTKVADLNTAIPGGTGNFVSWPQDPVISGANVAFIGNGSNGQQGVYVKFPIDPIKVVADTNTSIPGGAGNFTGFQPEINFGQRGAVISGANVVFIGNGSNGQQGVYVKIPIDPIKVVADTNTSIPGGTGNFDSLVDVALNAASVAFVGGQLFSDHLQAGVYVAVPPSTTITAIADLNTSVPGGTGSFTSFGMVAIDPDSVVFEGFSGVGKGLYTNLGGTLTKIIAAGDTIAGKTVSTVNFGPAGFSGNQVVFEAEFTDGSQAIALATFAFNTCPNSQGFWKKNSGQWPVSSLVLGGQTYSQSELLALLKTSTTSDASLILARQVIAAKLNIANLSDPAPVNSTISDADGLLAGFAGKLPYHVKPSSATGQAMTGDASTLDSYNNGALTPNCTP